MAKRILIAAGGTGGHLFPAITLAKGLESNYEILFVGANLSKNPFFDEGFNYHEIDCISPSFKKGLKNLKILKGVLQSLKLIKRYKPDLIIAFGSYHTFPILIAATLLKKRYILHEQNKTLGKVNRVFAKVSEGLISHYPQTIPHYPKKKIYASMPLRYTYGQESCKRAAKERLGLHPALDTILITGGSQGAVTLNESFLSALPYLKHKFQVIHLAGANTSIEDLQKAYDQYQIPARVRAFEKEMRDVLLAADIAFSRAGASSVAELIEFEIPALLVPYPYAYNHQEYNADHLEQQVLGGIKLRQKELNGSLLAKLLNNFLLENERQVYKENIQKYKKNNPSRCFIQVIEQEIKKHAKR